MKGSRASSRAPGLNADLEIAPPSMGGAGPATPWRNAIEVDVELGLEVELVGRLGRRRSRRWTALRPAHREVRRALAIGLSGLPAAIGATTAWSRRSRHRRSALNAWGVWLPSSINAPPCVAVFEEPVTQTLSVLLIGRSGIQR